MVYVKICGVTTLADALAAAEAGADMLGLNFYRKSPRSLEIDAARRLCDGLRTELGAACPLLIGLFVNEPVGAISVTMEKVGLRFVQLSGDESVDMLRELRGTAYKAIRPRTPAEAADDAAYFLPHAPDDERLPQLLVDAYHKELYGGTGETASLEVAAAVRAAVPRWMLAGGLTPENVGGRVAVLRPWAVDVASGVEFPDRPGVKDPGRLRAFVQAAKMLSSS